MNKPILLSAATSLLVAGAIVLAAHSASQAKGEIPSAGVTILDKSFGTPGPIVDEWDEAANEWMLDCYDQFGPYGGMPSPTNLERCLAPS